MSSIDVAEQLTRIPAQPLAAKLVLRLVEDPDAGPAQLARLVEMDPALSARVMRLANSAHYGLQEGVRSAARAVILLGFQTVRGLAAAAASSLLADEVNLGPVDYWAHVVSVAAATSVAGEALGIPGNEAFSAGLLHDVGAALFHHADPDRYAEVVKTATATTLHEVETEAYGMTHAEAGAQALEQWQFPRTFVQAVRTHHEGLTSVNPLAQAIMLGESLAERVEPLDGVEGAQPLEHVLRELGLGASLKGRLIDQARASISEISRFLGAIE